MIALLIAAIVAALVVFAFLCYKKAPPTQAIVVTGFGLARPRQQSRILASNYVGLLELTLSLEDAQAFQKAHNSVIKPSRWRDIDLEIYL